jgi:YHS domain-containing protein
MIRFLVLRLLVPLLILYLIRSLLRSLFGGGRAFPGGPSQNPARRQPPSVPAGGELKKDPVCGTYVSTAASVTRTVNGQVLYFCSAQCRDKYRKA